MIAGLRNRLYLNQGIEDGTLVLEKAPAGTLGGLALNTQALSASDVDADGDLDLFIGSRSIPGRYPDTPASHLLRNDSVDGEVRFIDATSENAPGLGKVGLVTRRRLDRCGRRRSGRPGRRLRVGTDHDLEER